MKNIFTLKDIEATGYKRWSDFYFAIKSFSGTNNDYTYTYFTSGQQTEPITLHLSKSDLQALVLEESKLQLRYIKINSFAALLAKYADNSSSPKALNFDVIVINKNDEVSFQQITFEIDQVIELDRIEKLNSTYIVYEEPKTS